VGHAGQRENPKGNRTGERSDEERRRKLQGQIRRPKKRVTGSNESHGQNIAFLKKKNERKKRTADRWKKKQI
jgi:hypothetical protein